MIPRVKRQINCRMCWRYVEPNTHLIMVFKTFSQILGVCSPSASCLTLKLFKSPLQLVVVEGRLAWESGARAGSPNWAEAGAWAPAGTGGMRWAGAAWWWRQGAYKVWGWGERPGGKRAGETAGGALKLHDETPEKKVADLDKRSPQRHRGETPQRNFKISNWIQLFPVECNCLQERKPSVGSSAPLQSSSFNRIKLCPGE